jgi:integrase
MANDPFELSPEDRVEIPAEEESDQIYVLSPDDEAAYLKAALECSVDLNDLAKIMLYQGPRPGEVMALAKANVDLAAKRFTIWFSRKKGKTKNAHRTLAITEQTMPIFEKRMQGSSQWLFPSQRQLQRKKTDEHIVTLQKPHEAVVQAIKLQCRIYDMRHTFATRFAL